MNRFFEKYISNKILSRFSVLVIDLFIIALSCMITYFLRYSFEGLKLSIRVEAINLILILVFFNTIFFFIFRTFRGILRFASFRDLLTIIYSISLGYAVSFVAIKIYSSYIPTFRVLNVVFFSTYILNVLLMVFSRILVKEVYEAIIKDRTSLADVFVYGTKEAGINIAKSLRGNLDFNYRVCGFISDEKQMIGKILLGVKVYENNDNLFRLLERRNIEKIIVSPQKMEEIQNSTLLNRFLDNNISLLTTPPLRDWKSSGLTKKTQLKEIQIEDLLPRDPIKINMRNIALHIEGKRIMVTGAAGSIGSEIVRQVAAFNPYSIILIDQAETPLHDMRLEMKEKWNEVKTETIVADISNASRMDQIFAQTRPQYIFHAAAYKHVPMMEDNVSESIQTNVQGTRILADLAVKYNAHKFVMISTDKAVNPSNVMGCSKRICEIYIQSLAKHLQKNKTGKVQFITTRFGNVLGSNGSVIPLFKEQIRKGGPVTVTHPEIIRYFMTIPEACQLVLEAGSMGNGGEIYIFDMGEPVKILDLAKRMIQLSGLPNVKIEFTGLRHGEKLYEELLNIAEYTKPTYHEKIMIANVREYEFIEIKEKIDDLIKYSFNYKDMGIVKRMKEIVPEFHSINSPYEAIDRLMEQNKTINDEDLEAKGSDLFTL